MRDQLRDLFQKHFPALTEYLANLTIHKVVIAVGVLMVLLAVSRLLARDRERRNDWLVENLQVVLSVVVVVFLLIRPFLFQAFYIPSGSMEPTLMGPMESKDASGGSGSSGTGDRLLVNKLIYRVTDPARKDIVVFKAPPAASPDEKEFIKRVIGLPGETLEVIPSRLLVDRRAALRLTNDSGGVDMDARDGGKPRISGNTAVIKIANSENPLRVLVLPDYQLTSDQYRVEINGKTELTDPGGFTESRALSDFGGDPSVQGQIFLVNSEPRLVVVKGRELKFDEGHVLINGQRLEENYTQEPAEYSYGPRKLGPNEYFMMGDNRNNSNDSHSWGALTRERVIGRAEVLFWPLQRFRILHWWLILAVIGLMVGYNVVQRLATRR